MIEAAFVFDDRGRVILYHLPPGRSSAYIPDSRDLWEVLKKNREILGGLAHSHPGSGPSSPSPEDVTTFSACELGLGKRLLWPIATDTHVTFWKWGGPGPYDYEQPDGLYHLSQGEFATLYDGIDRLRQLSEMRKR